MPLKKVGLKSGLSTPKKKTFSIKPAAEGSSIKRCIKKAKNPEATSKSDNAAIKIQSIGRRFLARCELIKLQKQKKDYENLVNKLQKQAWLEVIQKEKEEDEKQRLKEEGERRQKQEEKKWREVLLEQAFDGNLEEIQKTLIKAKKKLKETLKLSAETIEKCITKYHMSLIDCTDANENSLLSEACAGGNPDTITFLLTNGALINSLGQFHRTPLYRAAFGGHLEAVKGSVNTSLQRAAIKILLEHGGDPRLQDIDGVTPAEIAASVNITDYINAWDISKTEKILAVMESEKLKRQEEEELNEKKEQDRLKNNLKSCEKEYKCKQKMLQYAHEELNKRIYEHDKCTTEHPSKTDITLKAIEMAEDHLLQMQKEEKHSREELRKLKMELREKNIENVADENCVKCHIKELDEVLMRDIGDKIKDSGKWPLLVDSSGQAITFLRYRDTNYINTLNPKQMEPETIRQALIGAIRYGKSLVLDMMEVNMLEVIRERFDQIQQGLFADLLNRSIVKNQRYVSLLRANDEQEYKKDKFFDARVERFSFVLVSKMIPIPQDWTAVFYVIKIVTPAMH